MKNNKIENKNIGSHQFREEDPTFSYFQLPTISSNPYID
jgi:hypothetical protein